MPESSAPSCNAIVRIIFVTLILVAVCSANLATGRASLRPSAGKRSTTVLVGRSPAHYYQLAAVTDALATAAAAKGYVDELTCNTSIINARYQRLQEELNEIVELMEACRTPSLGFVNSR